MTFALSVNDFVDQIGAYAGIAAVVGLALFALLLFAQARELRHLREWGAHAHERIGELERRLAAALELARRAGAAQRTGAHTGQAAAVRRGGVPQQRPPRAAVPTAAASTRAPVRLPLLPAAPAGVGGAALGSATVFVPLPKAPPGAAPSPAPTVVPSPAQPAAAPAQPAAAPVPTRAVPTAAPAPAAADAPPAPAPATAAAQAPGEAPPDAPAAPPTPPAGTNGHSDTFPPVPPVRRATPPARPAAAGRPSARPGARPPARRPVGPPARAAATAARRPAPAAPLRSHTPSASPRGGGRGGEPPHGRRRVFALFGGLGLIVVAAVAVVTLSSGGEDSPSSPAARTSVPTQQTTAAGRQSPATPAPPHDRTTVAVLNGTTVPGLANTVASELEADGFLRGPVGNASDQQRSVTVVSYFGGREREAQEVADTLGVPADAVQAIDADTEASCAATAGACSATVVVTVGADRQ